MDGWVISTNDDGTFDVFLDRYSVFYGAGVIEEAEELVRERGGTWYHLEHLDGFMEYTTL